MYAQHCVPHGGGEDTRPTDGGPAVGSVSGQSPSCSQACASGSGAHTHTYRETRDERVNRRRCSARRLAGRVTCWAGRRAMGLRGLRRWGDYWNGGWMGNIGRGRTSSLSPSLGLGRAGLAWTGMCMAWAGNCNDAAEHLADRQASRRLRCFDGGAVEGAGGDLPTADWYTGALAHWRTGALARPARSVSSNPITAPRLHQSSPRSALAPSPTPTPIYHTTTILPLPPMPLPLQPLLRVRCMRH